ncbi:MAG: DNA mismatch repair protein MutS [Calditrichaeota bacterium]|nr:MAG: DNA mismatch repair protein MutS [Calditrichota bacterium]
MNFLRRFLQRRGKRAAASQPRTHEPQDEEIPEFVVVTDVLDLHGFFPEQVPEMVHEFVKNAVALDLTEVRIIHGKGKSKLKWVVRKTLEEIPEVAGFRDAPPERGGWGATIVYLRSVPDQSEAPPAR